MPESSGRVCQCLVDFGEASPSLRERVDDTLFEGGCLGGSNTTGPYHPLEILLDEKQIFLLHPARGVGNSDVVAASVRLFQLGEVHGGQPTRRGLGRFPDNVLARLEHADLTQGLVVRLVEQVCDFFIEGCWKVLFEDDRLIEFIFGAAPWYRLRAHGTLEVKIEIIVSIDF